LSGEQLPYALQQRDIRQVLIVQCLTNTIAKVHRLLSRMQLLVLCKQIVLSLRPIGIREDAIRRADQLALRFVLGTDAFGAFHRIDHVNWITRSDRLVRADWFASIAGGTCFGDH
jgi:hypothetical protein